MASDAITVKETAPDVAPPLPFAGVVTTTETNPGAATREAGTVALSAVELTNCVASAVPPNDTTDP